MMMNHWGSIATCRRLFTTVAAKQANSMKSWTKCPSPWCFLHRPLAYSRSASSSSTAISKAFNSRVSFRLANLFYAGVVGTLVVYLFRKKKRHAHQPISKEGEVRTTEVGSGRFRGKVVVITGGAGDIGRNTALAFAREQASVFLVDLPQTEGVIQDLCKELEQAGAKSASFVTSDVTNEEEVKKMVELVKAQAGRIDVFFNNAGVQGRLRPIEDQDSLEFKKVINVNIYGVFLGIKYVSKAMIEAGVGGVIVNTASLAGLLGPANMAAYTASKFAVVGMTKTAAKDLARHGIRVCAIAPGILEGKMWATQIRGNAECQKHIQGDNTEITDADLKRQEMAKIQGTPMKRQGKLSEVASVVTFLCSDDASYLTGITVPIDGGKLP